MSRVETIAEGVTLYLGDCRDIAPTLPRADAVVTDPPYGMKWNTDSSRFSGGHRDNVTRRQQGRSDWGDVVADDREFDPAPWLDFPQVILWGANHYAARLPVGTTLVWIKKLDTAFETFLSDAEVAWMKGGHGVYCRRDLSMNHATGTLQRLHPTQKPAGIMTWCIEKTEGVILDPYMGSGTTGVAAVKRRRPFIGIEIVPKYFDISCRQIDEAARQPDMFVEPPKPASQETFATIWAQPFYKDAAE